MGVEAAGEGVDTDKHAATLTKGSPGVLHGSMSYLLQDSEGQVVDPHSISAGCVKIPPLTHPRSAPLRVPVFGGGPVMRLPNVHTPE